MCNLTTIEQDELRTEFYGRVLQLFDLHGFLTADDFNHFVKNAKLSKMISRQFETLLEGGVVMLDFSEPQIIVSIK